MSLYLILWIRDFLVGRVQSVIFKEQISDLIVANTGATLGCGLSLLLSSLNENEWKSRHDFVRHLNMRMTLPLFH